MQRRQHAQGADLRDLPGHQHARDAEARRHPAAAGICKDAGRFIEQEHEGEDEWGVAEAVKVQQHQHAQRAVSDGEQEIRGGDDGVVADPG